MPVAFAGAAASGADGSAAMGWGAFGVGVEERVLLLVAVSVFVCMRGRLRREAVVVLVEGTGKERAWR